MIQPPAQPRPDQSAIVIPDAFKLDEDLAAVWYLMEFTTQNIFLTGRAGTGKSTLLNYFRKHTTKKVVVLAPTGLAAIQVGGATIHSFFGFPLRRMVQNDPDIRQWSKSHPRMKVLKKMDTLVIDEVSMVRADIMDAIDQSLRINLGNDIPFGGKQVILIGDAFQLAPVVDNKHHHFPDDDDEYNNPYFFSASVFRNALPKIIELKKIYRQHDENFIYLLNRIRTGNFSDDDLQELNKRCMAQTTSDEFSITLSAVNAIADKVNETRLRSLNGRAFLYKAKVEGEFHERQYPVSSTLVLREGAQVMLVKNDLEGRWVNGSLGRIEQLTEEEVWVRFEDGQLHRIDPATWENKTYTWDRSSNNISFVINGTFKQFPIRLAWAVTIHKSQGLTFDKIVIDIGRGAFAHGQLYVALSRCRSLEGITLSTRLSAKDVIVDEAVVQFAGKYRLG